MDFYIKLIAGLMIVDSVFIYFNLFKSLSILHREIFDVDLKKLALIEGAVGVIILLLKYLPVT